jgi:hypothetical protein
METYGQSHTPNQLHSPPGWTLYVSHHDQSVHRLAVFVHGFNGRAVSSWLDFQEAGADREWWQETDLLFIGYDSLKENISGVANRIRRELPKFFPLPFAAAMSVDGIRARKDIESRYDELVVIGHSLGGLIVRKALYDAAMKWDEDGRPSPTPALLTAKVRLFSPASAGFQAAGFLGSLRALSIWQAVEVFLRRASAYSDLQPGSAILTETRHRTEMLAKDQGFGALRARIVWANPDNVVIVERYDTDFVDESWDGTTHASVCKPKRGIFEKPLDFVETGFAT